METASCLGWGLRGLGAGRDGNGDFGLSVPLLKSPPSRPLPRALAPRQFLSTSLSVFLRLSLFLSLISLPLHLRICLPGSRSSQPPPPSPLGWLPFCPRPGQALMSSPPKGPRNAWPGHTPCPHEAVGAGVWLSPAPSPEHLQFTLSSHLSSSPSLAVMPPVPLPHAVFSLPRPPLPCPPSHRSRRSLQGAWKAPSAPQNEPQPVPGIGNAGGCGSAAPCPQPPPGTRCSVSMATRISSERGPGRKGA